MSDTIWWKYFSWLALFASPAAPLAFAWHRLLSGERPRKIGAIAAAATASCSLVWFVAATMNFRLLGSLYAFTRYLITGGNLGVVLACALFSLVMSFRRGPRAARLATVLACLMLALGWTWLGITYR